MPDEGGTPERIRAEQARLGPALNNHTTSRATPTSGPHSVSHALADAQVHRARGRAASLGERAGAAQAHVSVCLKGNPIGASGVQALGGLGARMEQHF